MGVRHAVRSHDPWAKLTLMSALLLSTWKFGTIANAAGWPLLHAGGIALDAVVAGATAVEDDESVDCVGVGGTPDASGEVTLDACVMTAPNRCGAVADIRRYANPTALARCVMERTPHVMLVGRGAELFAARQGFTPRALLTDAALQRWREWQQKTAPDSGAVCRGCTPPRDFSTSSHDTVSLLACDRAGHLAGACSTSGMAFKLPGRVGDSPIIGHGLYVDQQAGAAAATGNGELIMGVCGSFLCVELMRQGASPLDACIAVLRRIAERFDVPPDWQAAFIALAPAARGGAWASAALRPGFVHVISDDAGTRTESPPFVLFPQA